MFAPVLTRSGYGDHARDLAYAILQSDDYSLQILATAWGNTPWNGLDESTEKGRAIKACTKTSLDQSMSNPDIFIQLTIPNEFQRLGKYNIGITAGIETDLCKAEWIEGLNRMDTVIGVSEHTIKVFKESQYDKHEKGTNRLIQSIRLREDLKTEILFEGVDPEVFRSTTNIEDTVSEVMKDVKEEFCFLFVGHWLQGAIGHDRKDVGSLVSTFCQAFANKPSRTRPALILKTSSAGYSISDREGVLQKINAIQKAVEAETGSSAPSVYLLHGDLSEKEMNSLYNHRKVKAMVSFTKGEGFGRPLLEFSFVGKPVIAPKWSGQVDFLHENHTTLLPGVLEDVHPSVVNDWFMKDARWFKVDYGYAMRVLQTVHNKYDLYKKSAQEQQKYVKENFTYQKMVNKFLDILDKVPVATEVKLKLPKIKKL